MSEPTQKTKKISRRDAIKIIGAVTGATVLANLPSKWDTPEIASGVLPAHAQTSSILHTLTCGANFISTTTTNNSSVTISPPTSGISMTYNVATDGFVVPPPPASGAILTDGSGVATLANLTTSGTFATVTWSFTNPADGTGNCAQTISYDIF